jgi:hypothetical protein
VPRGLEQEGKSGILTALAGVAKNRKPKKVKADIQRTFKFI